MASEINLIRQKQLASDVWDFTIQTISGSFGSLISAFLLTGSLNSTFVYTTNTNQTVSGLKTFSQNPLVPYTGTSGGAVSLQYVLDQVSGINASLNSFLNNQYLTTTGNKTVFGNTYNSGSLYTSLIYPSNGNNANINLNSSYLLDNFNSVSVDWNNRNLLGNWNINGGNPVLTNSNQVISGIKQYVGEIIVPTATNPGDAVNLAQFNAFLQQFGTGVSSGYAGVSSFNGASGNIFSQGRGGIVLTQIGNIFSVSGVSPISGASFGQCTNIVLNSGVNFQRINFSQSFADVPLVLSQFNNTSGDPLLAYGVSGVDTSGFNITFSNNLPSSNYSLSYLALDSTGSINGIVGPQGQIGPSLLPLGSWNSGIIYNPLNFVNISVGSSWVVTQTHLSSTGNYPLSPSGYIYWSLLASGSGPAGQNAVPFTYQGTWNFLNTYNSGAAIFYSGSTYATLSNVTVGNPPPNNPWFLIAQGGAVGPSGFGLNLNGIWNSSTVYNKGDLTRYNKATYYNNIQGSNGLNSNPISLNSTWSLFEERNITYNGLYSAAQNYYTNDLAYLNTGFLTSQSIEYINTSDKTLLSLHPLGYYNVFSDCDSFTGTNLLELTIALKNTYHPLYGSGQTSGFLINNNSINQNASGWGVLTLVRGQKYFFDSELIGYPFIFTTDISGGSYNGQFVNNISTGHRLSANPFNYVSAGLGESFSSGTLLFTPDSTNLDNFYLQSPSYIFQGVQVKLINNNPWKVFVSGLSGPSGLNATGTKGSNGLAFNWRGNWDGSAGYNSGDSVFYNGSSYATNQSVISTQPIFSPWFIVAQKGDQGNDAPGLAFIWRGNWSSASGYSPNDSVFYNGSSFGTQQAVSGFIPSLFSPYWFPIALSGSSGVGIQGSPGLAFVFRGGYNSATTYNSGDSIYYNGSSYGLSSGTSLNITPDTGSSWDIVARGGGVIFNWRSSWNPLTNYSSGDAVFFNGSSYGTNINNTNYIPSDTSTSTWFLVAQQGSGLQGLAGPIGPQGSGGLSFAWRGNWNALNSYNVKDSVYYNGSSYGTLNSIAANSIATPDNSVNWFPIALQGAPGLAFQWEGNWNVNQLYLPNQAVYYNGRSYGSTSYVASGITPNPISGPWQLIADKGGISIVESYYNSGYVATLYGNSIIEKMVPNDFTFTGYGIGLIQDASDGTYLSGTIYRRNVASSKFTLTDFSVSGGLTTVFSGGFSGNVFARDRIGIDISGGAQANALGLSIGIFGWANSP